MIGRPTTAQIALDCARELRETVLPAVHGEAVIVAVQMLENVMRNLAVRASHEIAWMAEETAAMERYVRDAAEALGASTPLVEAIDRFEKAPRVSLHLDDVVTAYSAAGDAFVLAFEAAAAADDQDRVNRARELLNQRSEREIEAMAEWSPVGR